MNAQLIVNTGFLVAQLYLVALLWRRMNKINKEILLVKKALEEKS